MADSPITQKRQLQFRGPSTSDDYNLRIEENYQDLIILYNRMRLSEENLSEGFGRFAKDQLGLLQALADLEDRVANLELGQSELLFTHSNQIETSRFNGTQFEIAPVSQLTYDSHGMLTLPQVQTSSVSKLAFVDPATGLTTLPSTLATTVVGINSSADSTGSTVDTSAPELAMARSVGRLWQRNVISPVPSLAGAQMFLYIEAPTDLFTTANSNYISIHPFPAMSTDILELAYTTNVTPTMQDSDGYVTFPAMHVNDPKGVGKVPPGSWTNGEDIDLNAGYRAYYFDPIPITGLRIKMSQRNYILENGQYVYSYGASLIDLQNVKFLSAGSAMIRVDAPIGGTISNISDVQPNMWNVLDVETPEVFTWQAVWETTYNSGVYTLNPVALSRRVWIQVNLSTTLAGGSPALAGFSVSYT